MGKYQVDTEKGSYVIETADEAATPESIRQTEVARSHAAMVNQPMQTSPIPDAVRAVLRGTGGALGLTVPGLEVPGSILGTMGGDQAANLLMGTKTPEALTNQTQAFGEGALGAVQPMAQARAGTGELSKLLNANIPKPISLVEAQAAKSNQRLSQLQTQRVITEARKTIAPTMAASKEQAQNILEFVAAQKDPLQKEIETLKLANTRYRTSYWDSMTQVSTKKAAETMTAKTAKREAQQALDAKAEKLANDFADSLGPKMETGQMREVSKMANEAAFTKMQDQIGEHYDAVRNILSMPENAGKKVDLSGAQSNLLDKYAELEQRLRIARQQGSPGATALMQVFDGPDLVDGATAINNLKALNKISGYDKALSDAGINRESIALGRETAGQYRNAMQKSFAELPVGAEDVSANLTSAKALLKARDKMFFDPAAMRGIRSVKGYGDVGRLLQDPQGFVGFWNQMDPSAQQGARTQIADRLMGMGPRSFAKNWTNLSPEIKQTAFTPQQIATGDSIVSGGEKAMKALVDKHLAAQDAIATTAANSRTVISNGRKQLSQLDENINELKGKIESNILAVKLEAREARKNLVDQKALLQSILENKINQIRQNQIISMKTAEDRIARASNNNALLQKAGWAIAGAAGTSAAYSAWRAMRWGLSAGE